MKPLQCLPLLLSCLGLLRGETRGLPGTEPRRVLIPERSPLFIPTMNLTSALVMWSGTHAPHCRGAPIITVLHGEPWSFTSALAGRVRKSLYGGSIVIDDASRRDEGFYTICTSSSEPLRVIELVITGSHSLRYSFSFLSEPLPGVPQYSVVWCVDDVPIIGYTSESRRAGPRAPWMEKITDEEPQFWDKSTKMLQEEKKKLNMSLRNLMKQNNQAVGPHVLQVMLGCELREDGSAQWIEQYAYDGSNLNTANMGRATGTQDRGNSEEMKCTEHLKKLLKFGEESLRRRVPPRTLVSQRKSGDRTFLIGYAYGFYPREIEVKWVQGGVEIPWASKELLPNPDGTYQVRTTVDVQEGDDMKTYEFHVTHCSLPGTVTATYVSGPHGRSWRGRLLVLVSVVLVMAAVMILKRKPFLKRIVNTHYEGQRTREAQPSAERNQEVLMMLPHPLPTHHHNSDTAGSSTGSDDKDSTCKVSDETIIVNADTYLIESSEFQCT